MRRRLGFELHFEVLSHHQIQKLCISRDLKDKIRLKWLEILDTHVVSGGHHLEWRIMGTVESFTVFQNKSLLHSEKRLERLCYFERYLKFSFSLILYY